MRIVISGASGLIGSALVPHLTAAGHEVVTLVRGGSAPRPDAVLWDPATGRLDAESLGPVDAAIHLAGEGIASRRWSPAHKARVRQSRVQGTTLLAGTLASMEKPPSVLLSASAVGFYGDRGGALITEDDGPGNGFLAEVCQSWEGATATAEAAGIRVVHLRTGSMALSRAGGALGKLLPLFRLGLGGRLGSGRQYVSWISIDDEVAAIAFALDNAHLRGALNLTAPEPVTNAEFTRALGRALHRPAVLPVPAAALSAVLGREMASEMLLGGVRAIPARLEAAHFAFAHRTLDKALAAVLAKR